MCALNGMIAIHHFRIGLDKKRVKTNIKQAELEEPNTILKLNLNLDPKFQTLLICKKEISMKILIINKFQIQILVPPPPKLFSFMLKKFI